MRRQVPGPGLVPVGLIKLLVVVMSLAVAVATSPALAAGAPKLSADVADPASVDTSAAGVTLLVTGEMLIHPRVSRKAAEYGKTSGVDFDFNPMFDQVRPLISEADLAICHLEIQLGVPGVEIAPFPRLAAPGEFADALAGAGFDGCSTASNHANDQGNIGVGSTIRALDRAGIAHTGTAASPALAGGVLYDLEEVTIGQLSYTYAIQAHRREHDWSINKIDPDQIRLDAAALRRRGADFVIVSLHWGAEFRHQPTRSQRDVAGVLMASDDIDLIVGHHAHVLQPVEFVNEKPVLFGLGNFLSNQAPDCCGVASGDGAAVMLRLEPETEGWTVASIAYVPTWVHRRGGGYLVRPTAGYREGDLAWRHLRASLSRTEGALTIAGEVSSGLTVGRGIGWLRGQAPESPSRSVGGLVAIE